jgi:transcriptional regulator with XRE-family HTH domain
MNVGEVLKQARSATGLTQEAAAEKAGVSRQTMSNWENGRSYPDFGSIINLSDVYDVSLDSLLKGDTKMIKHLQESTDVAKSHRQVVATLMALIGLAMALFFVVAAVVVLGGDILNFANLPSILLILIPLLAVLTITRSIGLFFSGLHAAFSTKKELIEESRVQAVSLFHLLSKTAVVTAVIGFLINVVNMAFGMDFSDELVWQYVPGNIAAALIAPLVGLILIVFLFEPVAFLLGKKGRQ